MKRIVLVGIAALALTGCATSGPIATPSVPAPTPSPTPTASATPTAKAPTPSAATTATSKKPKATPSVPVPTRTPVRTLAPDTTQGVIAGAVGQVPQEFTLPDEQRAATDESTAFETTSWRVACFDDQGIDAPALDKLTATRIKASSGPEHVEGNGLLVFADDASAKAFLDQTAAAYASCAPHGAVNGGFRPSQASDAVADLGEQTVRVGSWWEYDNAGSWVESPGADITYLTRKGKYVALTYEGDESIGDPRASDHLTARAADRIKAMLAQV